MKISDILNEARLKILDPKHWTQEEMARDAKGNVVSSTGPEAVCWCSMGAICAVSKGMDLTREALDSLSHEMGSIPLFNDVERHETVIAAFNRAIDRERSRGN